MHNKRKTQNEITDLGKEKLKLKTCLKYIETKIKQL